MSKQTMPGDKSGWKRGAGVYSRSYLKTEPDRLLTKAVGKREILDRVEANSRNASGMVQPSLPGGPGGFSGKVSSGNRPKHRQGSWKRV